MFAGNGFQNNGYGAFGLQNCANGDCGQINSGFEQAIQNLFGGNGFQNNGNGAAANQNCVNGNCVQNNGGAGGVPAPFAPPQVPAAFAPPQGSPFGAVGGAPGLAALGGLGQPCFPFCFGKK